MMPRSKLKSVKISNVTESSVTLEVRNQYDCSDLYTFLQDNNCKYKTIRWYTQPWRPDNKSDWVTYRKTELVEVTDIDAITLVLLGL